MTEENTPQKRVLDLNVKNYFRALSQTPIGQEYPFPAIGRRRIGGDVVLKDGTVVSVSNSSSFTPNQKVIVYWQGIE